MKYLFYSLILSLTLLATTSCANANATTNPSANTNDDVILHAWTWSFNTIKDNMKDIADAGYTYVQTSPANECIVGDNGGKELFGKGKWYYHYQPTDWTIGNYQLGNRDEFKAMCDEAKKYGIKIIVDVLPNHTAIDRTKISARMDSAVGGRENLFHANGLTPITDYNDRFQCTTGEMGGLPDVNTENPDFQYYYMQYVNDLIACGADGFRYDTAKHIGLPTDPLDKKAKQNDFWDIATGRKAVKGLTLSVPEDSLFIYGEVLQDKNVKETEYAEYMDLTASAYGHVLRNILNAHNAKADSILNWNHSSEPKNLVTWVESHDTYCNAHESAGLTDDQIRLGWVFLTARQFGTPLFYSRPDENTKENVWGNNLIGARGNDSFKHPEVIAANKFRKAMHGQPEKLFFSNNNQQIEIARGTTGVALINLATTNSPISLATTLPNGTYTDAVSNATFTVKNGTLKGKMSPLTTYILMVK
ncbi:MAG: alpha-amylase family glycosyl hydrolase [Muribaculaceae bacterium]